MLMAVNYLCVSASSFLLNVSHLETTIDTESAWVSANFLSHNQSQTAFSLVGLLGLSSITITPSDSARVMFDCPLTMSEHNLPVPKSCVMSIRDLRRMRNILDSTTAKTIATYIIHSMID